MKPSDPMANATTGGTGPLNNDAACHEIKSIASFSSSTAETEREVTDQNKNMASN